MNGFPTELVRKTASLIPKFGQNRTARNNTRRCFGLEPLGEDGFRFALVCLNRGVVTAYTLDEINTREEAKTAIGKFNYSRGKEAVLSIPRHEAILKWIKLPSTVPGEIAQMIPHEARVLTPWPEQEGAVAYQIYEEDAEGNSSVLLFLVRTSTIEGYLSPLHELGIYPTRVEVSTISIGRLLEKTDLNERPAIARADQTGIEFARYRDGKPLFSRGISGDGNLDTLVRDSIALDERKHGKDNRYTFLLVADRPQNPNKIQDEISPGGRVLTLDEFRSPILNGVSGLTSEDMVCVGAALGADYGDASDNLLPESNRKSLAIRSLMTRVGQFATLSILALLLLLAIGRHYFEHERQFARATRAEITTLRNEVGDLDVQSFQLELLKEELETVSLPLEIVLGLYGLTPSAVAINHAHFDEHGLLILGGEASSFNVINDFLASLNSFDLLKNIELTHSSKSSSSTSDFVDFRLTTEVRR